MARGTLTAAVRGPLPRVDGRPPHAPWDRVIQAVIRHRRRHRAYTEVLYIFRTEETESRALDAMVHHVNKIGMASRDLTTNFLNHRRSLLRRRGSHGAGNGAEEGYDTQPLHPASRAPGYMTLVDEVKQHISEITSMSAYSEANFGWMCAICGG